MKVMVDGIVHDAKFGHVAILFEGADKANIANMPEDFNVYSSFPDDMDPKEVRRLNLELKESK